MIPEEAKKKHRLTQEDCDTARLLLARQRTLKEIADIIGVDPSTVGKIRVAGYDLETYLKQRKEMNRKTKENRERKEANRDAFLKKRWPDLQSVASIVMSTEPELPEEVPGQMQMQLDPPAEEAKQDEQTKLMRFQAAMMDRLIRKLDELIGVLGRHRE